MLLVVRAWGVGGCVWSNAVLREVVVFFTAVAFCYGRGLGTQGVVMLVLYVHYAWTGWIL